LAICLQPSATKLAGKDHFVHRLEQSRAQLPAHGNRRLDDGCPYFILRHAPRLCASARVVFLSGSTLRISEPIASEGSLDPLVRCDHRFRQIMGFRLAWKIAITEM
jgi:hypothetical protein